MGFALQLPVPSAIRATARWGLVSVATFAEPLAAQRDRPARMELASPPVLRVKHPVERHAAQRAKFAAEQLAVPRGKFAQTVPVWQIRVRPEQLYVRGQ